MTMWKEKYRIGVKEIDEQHQELFNRVSDFIKTVRSEGEWEDKLEKVKETLEFMKEYVVTHFDSEERFQEKIDYPYMDEHKQVHERFKGEVQKFADRFEEEGYDEELLQEFSGKLMTWLIYHVAGDDQKIGEFVENQGGEE